jgi:EAL domain-containing protein (putative c-di-GMP-specific phosphodiesterase class I)
MQRHNTSCLVLNFILNAIEPLAKSQGALEEAQKKLQEVASATTGAYYEMSNGDVFIAWENPDDSCLPMIHAIEEMLAGYGADTKHALVSYRMPENYTTLRERTNDYVEVVRAAAITGNGDVKVESAQGKLTAKNVDQIGQLLGEIDLRRYGRTQSLYHYAAGSWSAVGEEYFIGFEDLRREHFPKLEIPSSEHFFLALCGMLDQRLLALLTSSYEIIGGRRINLNVSVGSIIGPVFTQFVHRVPREHRSLIGFELHCGDLFQDFSLAIGAIDLLKREGFRVIIDGVTPDMIGYLDLAAFAVDAVKINVSKERALQLADPAVRLALERLPADRLIFFRCDNQNALSIGHELGVSTFQGWLIDDLASKKK